MDLKQFKKGQQVRYASLGARPEIGTVVNVNEPYIFVDFNSRIKARYPHTLEIIMSGGYFNYKQSDLEDIIVQLREIKDYPKDILDKFKHTANTIESTLKILNNIDMLLSGDMSRQTFTEGWPENDIDLRIDAAVRRIIFSDQFDDLIRSLIESKQ